jgi:hypothetical protein
MGTPIKILIAVLGCFGILFFCTIATVIMLLATRSTTTNNPDTPSIFKSTSSTTKKTSTNDCFSVGKKLEKNPYIQAQIQTASGEGSITEVVNKNVFTIEELKSYSYGFSISNNPEGYYVDYELCNLENNETMSFPSLAKESYKFYDPSLGAGSEGFSMYASTDFQYKDGFEIYDSSITEPGTYSVDAFAATESSDWKWVDRFEFIVE